MRHITTAVIVAAFMGITTLSGCSTGTRSVEDSSNYEGKLIRGKTTKAEVEAMLGKPFLTSKSGGNTIYNYTFARGPLESIIKMGTAVSELNITFNSKGILTSYETTNSN